MLALAINKAPHFIAIQLLQARAFRLECLHKRDRFYSVATKRYSITMKEPKRVPENSELLCTPAKERRSRTPFWTRAYQNTVRPFLRGHPPLVVRFHKLALVAILLNGNHFRIRNILFRQFRQGSIHRCLQSSKSKHEGEHKPGRLDQAKHVQCNFVVFFGCDRTSSEKQHAVVRLSELNGDNADRQQTSPRRTLRKGRPPFHSTPVASHTS